MKVITVWFYDGVFNFGDQLTLYILNHYGLPRGLMFKKSISRVKADMIGIGSILHSTPKDFKGIVWTSGCRNNSGKGFVPNDLGKIWGIRGPLSRAAYKLPKTIPVGDGALVLRKIVSHWRPTKTPFLVGILPHYVDKPWVFKYLGAYLRHHRSNVLFIDVQEKPVTRVIQKMRKCQSILSSSLHGLIVADALGIPNHQFRIPTSKKIVGGLFKYKDYYNSIGIKYPQYIHLTPSSPLISIGMKIKKRYSRPHVPAVCNIVHKNMLEMLRTLSPKKV